MTDRLDTLFARLLDQLRELHLRLAELEVDAAQERLAREKAERALQAKIALEAEEKFNASLGNAVEINKLENRVDLIEDRLTLRRVAPVMLLVPVERHLGDSP